MFILINHDDIVVKYITKFELRCPGSTVADYYMYLLYKYIILLATMDDSVAHTVRELCELRVHVNTVIPVLLDQLCIE